MSGAAPEDPGLTWDELGLDDEPGPEWEALAMGTLTAEQAAELQARDPERFELYRPLTEEQRERIWKAIERSVR